MLACRLHDGGAIQEKSLFCAPPANIGPHRYVVVNVFSMLNILRYLSLVFGTLQNVTLVVLSKHGHASLPHIGIDTIETMKTGAEISDINGNESSKYGIVCFRWLGIHSC